LVAVSGPTVAIVTPVYNGAQFLAETMECVQAQTYPHIIHCILDNASTDATPGIVAGYQGRRIPLITARNAETQPMIDNWNAALKLLPRTTVYFRTLPADDLMVPHAIERMVALGEQYPEVSLVSCQEWMGPHLLGADIPSSRSVFDGRSVVRASLLNAIGFPHLHCLYRYPRCGLPRPFYQPDFHGVRLLATDVDAAMRTLISGTCAYVHEPLVTTRWHAATVTSTDMIPNHNKLWSDLQLIDRWGPLAFNSEAEYRQCRDRHLRFYYRHLLLWHIQGKRRLLDLHHDWLRRAVALPYSRDYAYAALEWPLSRAKRWFRQAATRLNLVHPNYALA